MSLIDMCVKPLANKTNTATKFTELKQILFPENGTHDDSQAGGGIKQIQTIICFIFAVLCGIYPNPAYNELHGALMIFRNTYISPQCVPPETTNIISRLVEWVGMDPHAKCIREQKQFNLDNQVYVDMLTCVLIMCISASLIGLASGLISIVNNAIDANRRRISVKNKPGAILKLSPDDETGESNYAISKLSSNAETGIILSSIERKQLEKNIHQYVLNESPQEIARLATYMFDAFSTNAAQLHAYQTTFGPLPTVIPSRQSNRKPKEGALLLQPNPIPVPKRTLSRNTPGNSTAGGSKHKKNKRKHRRYTKKCKW